MKKHLSKFENDLTDSVVFQIMSEFDTQTHGGVGFLLTADNVLRAEEEHPDILGVKLRAEPTSGRPSRRQQEPDPVAAHLPILSVCGSSQAQKIVLFGSKRGHYLKLHKLIRNPRAS